MNYPYNVAGGQTSFFPDFEYRFSDPELLFMRHAPYRFVQQGNALWFDHHGFQRQRPPSRRPPRAARESAQARLEFLEPGSSS